MKISLRKAAKIRSGIETRLKELVYSFVRPEITIHVLETDVEYQIEKAAQQFRTNFNRYNALSDVLIGLRMEIGNVNAGLDVNIRLATIAGLNARHAIVKNLASNVPSPSDEQMALRVSVQKERHLDFSNSYAVTDTIKFPLFTEEDIASFKEEAARLRKEIEKNTEILEHTNNIANTVNLHDEWVTVLTDEGLL